MKIKIGKKYRVRSDLVVGEVYGEHAFVDAMKKNLGKEIVFGSAFITGYFCGYHYTPEMLEKVKKSKWQPIETVPINERVIAWSSRHNYAISVMFTNGDVLNGWSHWMPLMEGPR